MNKLTIILAIFLCTAFWSNAAAASGNEAEGDGEGAFPPSSAYVLIEQSTGQILSAHNADRRLPPASLTKIMVLLLVAEEVNAKRLSLSDSVTVSAHASSMDGSVIWLEPGEIMTVGEMVKAVVISSANDATVALAEHIGKSEGGFVRLMNQKAYVLGMSDTSFTNAVGYDEPQHYTTARDVAKMSRALMRSQNYEHFSEHMLTRLCSVRTGTERETQLLNTNNLITYYKGIQGIKTGTTDNAGYCLSAAAVRNSLHLISVVMGCKDEFDRVDLSEKLLDYGFNGYELHRPDSDAEFKPPVVTGGVERELAVKELQAPAIVIKRGRAGGLKYESYLPEKVTAPVVRNQPVGTITATLDGEVVYESYIVAEKPVREMTFMRALTVLCKRFLGIE